MRTGEASRLEGVLNDFAQRYLHGVRVKLDRRLPRGAGGQSNMERKVIRLSPRQDTDADAIALGLSYAYRIGPKYRKMKLTKNEMLFLTLLHEVAHFRIGERVPRFYHKLRRELEERGGVSKDEIPIIEKYIRRKRGESEESWKPRIADFESWLVLDETITHHMKVENWAIEEFEKRRARIREELRKSGIDFHD
ncbi:MAG: hypothetical protein OK457_05405 [Thaumarchaeota archaeon]|nr:hypothetical protein [Nitrososphaerota archaeon]